MQQRGKDCSKGKVLGKAKGGKIEFTSGKSGYLPYILVLLTLSLYAINLMSS
ncbi:unnamed protein product [Gulo gulo]|uniref:Uncharacterized protein n=1 Tax=Gulo gulo TaxID=48420 RepID=A0A9X9QAD8_GULGU|nr:unnamed protein product [Gulo gulo]